MDCPIDQMKASDWEQVRTIYLEGIACEEDLILLCAFASLSAFA